MNVKVLMQGSLSERASLAAMRAYGLGKAVLGLHRSKEKEG